VCGLTRGERWISMGGGRGVHGVLGVVGVKDAQPHSWNGGKYDPFL